MAEITTAYGQKIRLTTDEHGNCILGLDDVDPRNGQRTTLAEIGMEPHEFNALIEGFKAAPRG